MKQFYFLKLNFRYIILEIDDYKEIMLIALAFFGETTNCKISATGAIHRARWMYKIIYVLKNIFV